MAGGLVPRKTMQWSRSRYLDACVIDEAYLRDLIRQSTRDEYVLIVSHLGIGEAYATTLRKHGRKKCDRLMELVGDGLTQGRIGLIDHDPARRLVEAVETNVPELDFADVVHVATALHIRCERLLTTDQDLLGVKKQIRRLESPETLTVVRPSA